MLGFNLYLGPEMELPEKSLMGQRVLLGASVKIYDGGSRASNYISGIQVGFSFIRGPVYMRRRHMPGKGVCLTID